MKRMLMTGIALTAIAAPVAFAYVEYPTASGPVGANVTMGLDSTGKAQPSGMSRSTATATVSNATYSIGFAIGAVEQFTVPTAGWVSKFVITMPDQQLATLDVLLFNAAPTTTVTDNTLTDTGRRRPGEVDRRGACLRLRLLHRANALHRQQQPDLRAAHRNHDLRRHGGAFRRGADAIWVDLESGTGDGEVRLRSLLAASLCCAATVASAQMPLPVQIEKQREARRVLTLDFTRGIDPRIQFRRAGPSAEWTCTQPNVLATYGTNVPAFPACDPRDGANRGLSLYGSSQYGNRWSSDLTNAYWTKTGATAARVTGADGVASSGSRLSATTANGTACVSTPTPASYQKITSAYVKRAGGIGPVFMSGDGGITWSEVTGSINSASWKRVPIGGLYQSAANAAICFKLANAGDAIDIYQALMSLELNSHWTEPSPAILTAATGGVFRNPDIAWMSMADVPGFDSDSFSVILRLRAPIYIYPFPQAPARRGFLLMDDGAGIKSLMFNLQADAGNPGTACNTNPGVPATILCASINVDHWYGPTYGTTGKVRCSPTGVVGDITRYIPPMQDTDIIIAYTYRAGRFDAITCNNGGPPQTLSDGFFYRSGNNQLPIISAVTPVDPTGTFKRMVFGSTPTESHGLGGTITVGDTLTDTVSWEMPAGTVNTATVNYTTQSGDTIASAVNALINLINATPAFTSAGFSATLGSDGMIWPAHSPRLLASWTITIAGAKTETFLGTPAISGPAYGFISNVQVYSPALAPYALASVIPNSLPSFQAGSFVALQQGGNMLYDAGPKTSCNRC